MLFVLSPAKALDFSAPESRLGMTAPQFDQDVAELSKTTRKLSVADLKRLMSLSDKLAELNRARFQAFDPESEEGLQAALAFNGDVYSGLRARQMSKADLDWAQDHLRILSGLYGLLRPLDVIQPYRLEMGTRLKTPRGATLYDFWADRIALALNAAAKDHADPTLVNLASQEYFGAVDARALKLPVLGVRFLEEKDGHAKIVSFYAKKARGLMARWAIDNRISRVDDLKAFDLEGYRFAALQSQPGEWTFTRPQPTAASAA
ncbi:MAG: peroxide stress protein YaaA [Phenylobacterium sp.]|uniref:peroxide stress protein YaaA n=1 Tax=Phenylobacterium sp. TaxID=1871053 RepID=UPI0025EE19E2|nr:peroxide stress protein YaaA [Phenylobacterium sp.]MCG9917213.1 peroxide stress protein YaaA [Phenylobacterium sp.]